VRRLGRYLEDVSLESMADRTHLAGICHSMARYVESPQLVAFLQERLEASAPRSVRVANSLGIVTYHALSKRIAGELRQLLIDLPANAGLIKALEERVHSVGEELQQRGSPTRDAAYRIMDTLVEHTITASRGQIAQTVRENLTRLSDDEIRRQIETRTRTHLDWIRVNGGIFGAIFGALFGLLNYAVAHGAALMALLH
jgi:polyhydroxyalkanoate synthesis regulator phasin